MFCPLFDRQAREVTTHLISRVFPVLRDQLLLVLQHFFARRCSCHGGEAEKFRLPLLADFLIIIASRTLGAASAGSAAQARIKQLDIDPQFKEDADQSLSLDRET